MDMELAEMILMRLEMEGCIKEGVVEIVPEDLARFIKEAEADQAGDHAEL